MEETPNLKTEKKETPQFCNGIFSFMTALKDYLQRDESKDEIPLIVPEPQEAQTKSFLEHLQTETQNTNQPSRKRFAWKGRQ